MGKTVENVVLFVIFRSEFYLKVYVCSQNYNNHDQGCPRALTEPSNKPVTASEVKLVLCFGICISNTPTTVAD